MLSSVYPVPCIISVLPHPFVYTEPDWCELCSNCLLSVSVHVTEWQTPGDVVLRVMTCLAVFNRQSACFVIQFSFTLNSHKTINFWMQITQIQVRWDILKEYSMESDAHSAVGDQIKVNNIGGMCSIHRCTKIFVLNPKGKGPESRWMNNTGWA
jgi:hypothetical protein